MANYVQPVDYQPPQQYQPQQVPQQYQQYNQQEQLQFNTTNEFDILTQSPVYTVVEKLISHIQIPDKVDFEHKFSRVQPCLCSCGELRMTSEFGIQGLGEFLFSLGVQLCCGYFCHPNCCGCNCQECNCDYHEYPYKMYEIKNQAIEMEYWHQGIGKISVGNRPIIDFKQCHPNGSDLLESHFCSSYPKLKISYPFEPNQHIIIAPEINTFPETCLGTCCCLAAFQLLKLSRNYVVNGLKQGKCEIINSRNIMQAAAKCSHCQGGCCCCPVVDYPEYTVIFQGVRQLDKIAILMGLMHMSFYKHWCITGFDQLVIKYNPIL